MHIFFILSRKFMKYKKEKKFGDSIFREGDRIMQIKNNYEIYWEKNKKSFESGSGIFNGEFGTIQKIDEKEKNIQIKLRGMHLVSLSKLNMHIV